MQATNVYRVNNHMIIAIQIPGSMEDGTHNCGRRRNDDDDDLPVVLVGMDVVAVNQCDGQAIWQSRFESVRHRIVSPLCIQEQCLTTREGIARRIVTKL